MTKTQAWINALRLRTLPLSMSGVLLGSFIALSKNAFNWKIFVFAMATTLFLQILSNLANDYGDSKNGKDNAGRKGPQRMVQSGLISLPEMKRMVLLFCAFSLISGISLILISHIVLFSKSFFVLLGLGLVAIWASLKYTIGKNPYGYSGWGDISVFIFFGLFSVTATTYLYTGHLTYDIFLLALTVGAFSVGVLNLNNMRDFENDKNTGKITIVVKMGSQKAKFYHLILLTIAVLSSIAFLLIHNVPWYGYLFVLILFPLIYHAKRIVTISESALYDAELKKLAIMALIFSLTIGIGINF
jgi:1,4-dihydroxy-2-naphthoate octaprenyltransferase